MLPTATPAPLAAGDKPSPVAAVLHRVRDILNGTSDRSQAQRDALLAFFVRVVSAGLLYVSQIVLARWMGAHEYGIYVFVWTMVLVLGGISHLGLNMGMMRLLPAYLETGKLDLMRGLLSGGRWLAMYVGLIVTIVVYALLRSTSIAQGSPYLEPALAILICVPIFALTDLQDGLGRGRGWMAVALFPPYVLRPLVLLVTMGFAHLAGLPMDALTAALAAIVACWAAAIVQTLLVQARLEREVPPGPRTYDFGAWLKVSMPLLAMYVGRDRAAERRCARAFGVHVTDRRWDVFRGGENDGACDVHSLRRRQCCGEAVFGAGGTRRDG